MLAAWGATFALGTQIQPHAAKLAEELVDAADTPAQWARALLWLSRAQMAEYLAVVPFMVSVNTSPFIRSHTATVGTGCIPLPPVNAGVQVLRAAFAQPGAWSTDAHAMTHACNLNMYALRFVTRLQAHLTARE